MKKVNVHAAKTHLSKLVEEVERGAEITIARNGKPVARLVPLEERAAKRRLGAFAESIELSKDFDAPLPDEIGRAFGL